MKKLSIFLFTMVALIGLNSCSSDDDVVFVAQPDLEGINFMNSFNDTYVLTPATATNIAERFVWNTVDFSVPTPITYQLQGSTTEDFSSFDIIGSTSTNNLGVTVAQMMSLAEDAGIDNDAETENPNTGQVYFRVKAFAGDDGSNPLNEMSEVRAVTVVMPEGDVEEGEVFKNLFLVGNATAAGWNPNNNNTPLFRAADNPNVYNYTGYFGAGEFKLLEIRDWQPQWGLVDGNLTNSDILGEDPGSFVVETAGYYSLVVDIEEMTYSFEPFDASGATTYASIGLIGDSTPGGWDADTDMTSTEFDSHIWYLGGVELGDGFAKFRADDAWDVNWGADTPMSGLSAMNGPDIPVAEGTYDVWFNDLSRRYIFVPIVTEE